MRPNKYHPHLFSAASTSIMFAVNISCSRSSSDDAICMRTALLSSELMSWSFLLPFLAPLATSSTFITCAEAVGGASERARVVVEEAMEMTSSLLVSAFPRNSVPAFRPVHVQRGSKGREGVRSQSNRMGGERTIVEESKVV